MGYLAGTGGRLAGALDNIARHILLQRKLERDPQRTNMANTQKFRMEVNECDDAGGKCNS